MKKPTIVAPGGSLDKALIALSYGADSVYIGAKEFGLRKSSDNFSLPEIESLCSYASSHHKTIYLTLNIYPHQTDIKRLKSFLCSIRDIGLSALIISDLGLCSLAKELTNIPIHVSTQSSILNSESAKMWAGLGVKRIVLAREASLSDASIIKHASGCETEVFIHGAMCSSFSGKCTISNISSGRDSNRGGCVQSCRHSYQLSNGDTTHIMNSKDLRGISLIPDYFKYDIDAVKIEGRMKSPLYVANAVQQYRNAIDLYAESPEAFDQSLHSFETNLERASNRGFTTASLNRPAGKSSISYDWNGYTKSHQFLGFIRHTNSTQSLLQSKAPIKSGDRLLYLSPNSSQLTPVTIDSFSSHSGATLPNMRPNECAWINQLLPRYSIIMQ